VLAGVLVGIFGWLLGRVDIVALVARMCPWAGVGPLGDYSPRRHQILPKVGISHIDLL
jgi:hypothetical protein